MSRVVIQVEDISKQYRLGQVGTGTLSHDINRWWHRIRKGYDPYLKVGEENDRSQKGSSDYVWALQNINFEVRSGEVLGIIGKNGAGKSTLLKILSRTTTPTTGKIAIKGRVASLLEVGTGFHPELSGRENIFLNGAILGMTRREIRSKFDEIVDFAGVERYIETPVKRYSSGMYVRLAFAVAAHLEPEILIVDEVLAVGDAEFQKKCMGKMNDVSKNDGRTILFVSHNIQAIKTLCSSAIYLKNGLIADKGGVNQVVNHYLQTDKGVFEYASYNNAGSSKDIYVQYASCVDKNDNEKFYFSADEPVYIRLRIQKNTPVRGVYGHVTVSTNDEIVIIETDTLELDENALDSKQVGIFHSVLKIPSRILKTGTYYVSLGLASELNEQFQIESLKYFLKFDVTAERTGRDVSRVALTSTILEWNFEMEEQRILV